MHSSSYSSSSSFSTVLLHVSNCCEPPSERTQAYTRHVLAKIEDEDDDEYEDDYEQRP